MLDRRQVDRPVQPDKRDRSLRETILTIELMDRDRRSIHNGHPKRGQQSRHRWTGRCFRFVARSDSGGEAIQILIAFW